jgi:hypothetical protein
MKKQTIAEKKADMFEAYKQIRAGEEVKRTGAKDGSIPTHPVVEVDKAKPESEVLSECLSWLKRRRIFCNRHDCGAGNFGSGYATYGIRGSGDIHGMLRHHGGKHFEIECKKGAGGRLSKDQQERMKDVRDNKGLYFVVHGVEELEHFMGEYV